jgi:Lrp/AsnC family transcriptional regulator, leucine-responsive regulatory protein
MPNIMLDAIDLQILRILQIEGKLTNTELAERVGLSATPCLRRVKRLEQEGIITGYRAELNRAKVGLGLTVLVDVKVEGHRHENTARILEALKTMPEVLSCHLVSGEFDLMLEVTVPDLQAYERFLFGNLSQLHLFKDIRSHVVLRTVSDRTPLPLAHLETEIQAGQ